MSSLLVSTIRNEANTVNMPVSYLQRRVVQRVTRWFRGGLWNPGNTYYEIPGSFINITPFYSYSRLVYTYMCPLGHRQNVHSISHWILMAGGEEFARHNRSNNHNEAGHIHKWDIPSWGRARSGSIGYIARQYGDGTHSVHYNGRRYLDGGDASQSVPSWVSIEEYVPQGANEGGS